MESETPKTYTHTRQTDKHTRTSIENEMAWRASYYASIHVYRCKHMRSSLHRHEHTTKHNAFVYDETSKKYTKIATDRVFFVCYFPQQNSVFYHLRVISHRASFNYLMCKRLFSFRSVRLFGTFD